MARHVSRKILLGRHGLGCVFRSLAGPCLHRRREVRRTHRRETFHSVSEKHLQRYADEFDFRWNTRQSQGFDDSARAEVALRNINGKRLTYRRIGA